MKTAARIEIVMIVLGSAGVFLAAPWLPQTIRLGSVLVIASGVLLFQGLIRDVCLLAAARRRPPQPVRKMACMCIESTFGVMGMIIGTAILGAPLELAFSINAWGWFGLALGVMVLGFLFRDYVFGWRPFRLIKDPDHLNIVFKWKP